MDRREELRKRLLNQQGKNDTQNTINTMKNLGLDLDRIRDVDRQAKLYDKPNHSIGQDRGLSEMVDDEGNYDINRENLQQSINDRERLLRERFESHNLEKKEIIKLNIAQRKESIMLHMESMLNEFDAIDKLLSQW